MFCGNCGKEISDESQFCPYCGAKISRPDGDAVPEAPGPDPASSENGKNGKKGPGKGALIGIICAAAAVAVIGGFIFRNAQTRDAGAKSGETAAAAGTSSHLSASSVPASSAEISASSAGSKPIKPTTAASSAEASKPIAPTPAVSSAAAGSANNTAAQAASPVSAGKITQVTASSTLVQSPYNYDAGNITDGDLSTAWVEGASGTGIGENVTLTYDGVYQMQGFSIRNGYQKKSDLYTKNARPKTIELIFSDGSAQEFELADGGIAEQKIQLSAPVNSSSVTLVIKDVYPGTKYEDTAITEFSMY